MPQDFSVQDLHDLVTIRSMLPQGDPRADKIDQLLIKQGAGFLLKPPGMPAPPQPNMQPNNLATAIQNSPSGADPQNPANPTQQGLAQMSPEGREAAQNQLMTGAAMTIPAMASGSAASKTFSGMMKQLSTAAGREEAKKFAQELALKAAGKAVQTAGGAAGGYAAYKALSKK